VSASPSDANILSGRVRMIEIGAPASAIHFLGDVAVFVCTEETAVFAAADGALSRVALHDGAILCSASDGGRIVTGGDDGKIRSLDAARAAATVAADPKSQWIDTVALHGDGAVAWSASRTAFVKTEKGETKTWDAPSTIGGLAFAPKGFRLAIAHYNGVSLWFPNMAGVPERLEWKGSHLGVAFSPDGKFLVTVMHEPALHGWRLADAKNMRMTGYPARVKSMSWSAGGKWLATSGANEVIAWPFQTKDGPMGKQPAILAAPNSSGVSAVACHPAEAAMIAGYGDGAVRLIRLPDGAEIVLRESSGSAVAAVAWNARGTRLAFALEDGSAGLLSL
jgi:WD40 repeat protein